MNYTDFLMRVPDNVRQGLSDRARAQTVARYGPAARAMVEAAIRATEEGHVILTGHNTGRVQDGGIWLHVDMEYCGHCGIQNGRAVCWHKLAVAFADLLARHAPEPQETAPVGAPSAPGLGVTGGHRGGGYATPLRAMKHGRPRGKQRHCDNCGAFLTLGGQCHNCGRD